MFGEAASTVRRGLLALGTAGLLCGCAIGPVYTPPTAEVPTAYKELGAAAAAADWVVAQPDDATTRGAWWEVFGDARLNALEQQVDAANLDLQKAMAQLREARAAVTASRAALFPTIDAGAAADQSLTSATVRGKSLAGKTVPDYALPLGASWEFDLWDRIGHAVDAARADAQASAADLEGLRLSLHAELANDYFNLCGLDREIALLQQNVLAYQEALTLTQNRFKVGIASGSDVAQAQTLLDATEAQLLDLELPRAQYEHAIATLSAQPASVFSLEISTQTPAPPQIPAGIPAQLLQRRPDIAAAERRVAAANAQIGIAEAAFYPDLSISGSVGLESTRLASLLTAPSLFWAIGPQLVGSVFDGGKRSAGVAQAKARYDASVADYRLTVLRGIQETEDALAAVRVLDQEAIRQAAATASAETAEQLARNRYAVGTAAYLEVVVEESIALNNERSTVEIDRRRLAASVALVRAMGGSWSS